MSFFPASPKISFRVPGTKSILNVILAAVVLSSLPAHSQAGAESDTGAPAEASLPPALVDVGIEEHLESKIPLDAKFLDENGRETALSEYFQLGKPVLFNFAYYRCPMLCNLVLAGMVEGIKKMAWTPGVEFEVVTVSMDPKEGPAQALAKKKTHIEALGKPEAAAGWHFLTGKEKVISRVAKAIGFNFHYNAATDDFSHAAAIFALSPDGKICRYLYGVDYPPKDLRLALLEAKDCKALSIGEKLTLFCYHYDPNAKGYVLFAQNSMRGGGYVVLAGLILLLGLMWKREIQNRKTKGTGTAG